jgi:Protein of unknown function (DUF4238)
MPRNHAIRTSEDSISTKTGIRQHWIPQFYQRRFVSDGSGLIWVYGLDCEPRHETIRKTGMAIDFYAFTKNEARDNQSVEAALQKLDHLGAHLIRKIDRGHQLTDQERYNLSEFISVMWRRTAKHKKEAERRAAAMMPDFFGQHNEDWLIAELEKREVAPVSSGVPFEEQLNKLAKIKLEYTTKVPDFVFARNVVRTSVFERVLYLMDWAFFRSSENQDFITSDNPVVFSTGRGLKHDDAVIFFPLSRKLCLQGMWRSQYRGAYVQATNSQIGVINRYVAQNADREIYASYKSRVLADFVYKWIDTFESPNERIRHRGRARKKKKS